MQPKPFFIKNIKFSTPRIGIPESRITLYTPPTTTTTIPPPTPLAPTTIPPSSPLPSTTKTPTERATTTTTTTTIPPIATLTPTNALTIITPCCRQQNIPIVHDSIQFDKIDKWIIVYDTSRDRTYPILYDGHPQIVEVGCDEGISGNPQRNYGMSLVEDGFIYFLDDDNIIHPNFWTCIDQLNSKHFYTFDQQRTATTILHGNDIRLCRIDTAMFIVHKQHIKHIKWITDRYDADGLFISHIHSYNYGAHIYLNTIGCYYNFINPT